MKSGATRVHMLLHCFHVIEAMPTAWSTTVHFLDPPHQHAATRMAEQWTAHCRSPSCLTSRQATFMLGPSLTLPSASTKMPCGRGAGPSSRS